MFHPVGSQPPSVYWRRRLVVLGTVVVLVVLLAMTLKVIASGGDEPAEAQGSPQSSGAAKTSGTTSSPRTSPSKRLTSSSAARSHSTSRSVSSTPPPPSCATKDLKVSAVTAKSTYAVGDQPLLELEVANTGKTACVQDLADKQVELKVYNGESRVWGSHDCKVEPGTSPRMLAPNTPVRVAITWSGLSSRPSCAGTRQRVGAGTYTLYGALSGKTGHAAQFTIG